MIQDPFSILAYLAAVVGVVFQLGRLEALRPLFDRVPALGLLVAQLLAGFTA